ncbi:MAG TPA: DUF4214 domain-containing protein [Noviherbaspirillum sp.]
MGNIYGTTSSETLTGTAGDDDIYGQGGNDTIYGGAGNDTLVGYGGSSLPASNSVLYGEAGDDFLYGLGGDDRLYGGDGDDALVAGNGLNILDGGAGNDSMYGGTGTDYYVVHDRGDQISDQGGTDYGVIHVDFYKPNPDVENWTWATGVQRLPYWIDALLPAESNGYPDLLGPGKTFYYVFPTTPPSYLPSADTSGFSAFNEQQKTFARQAMAYIASVIDVRFVEATDVNALNTIVFANNAQQYSSAYAYYPYADSIGSDVFMDNTTSGNLTPREGHYAALTLIHELGHALGLKHTFDDAGSGEGPYLPAAEESTQWSVMSYSDRPQEYYLRYSPFDIAALQYLYGPSTAQTTSNTYSLRTDSSNFIWDGGGIDTIDGSAISQAITLNLTPGYWGYIGAQSSLISSAGQITVNFGTTIENAKGGSAGDTITGNSAANQLWGLDGNDTLRGGGGNDAIDGGAGTDTAGFTGGRSGFTIMKTVAGYRVSVNSGPEDVDTLAGIERLAFDDTAIDLEYHDAVQQLYVSYFGRAADTGGLANFTAALATASAPKDIQSLNTAYTTNATVRSLVDAFGTSTESNNLYTGNTASFVTAIFQNVLNRAPQTEGLEFWQREIDAGRLTKGNAGLSIMAGALVNATSQGMTDAALINNKIRVASNFTFGLDTPTEVQNYRGAVAAGMARSMLATVSSTTDTDVFQSTVTATIASLPTYGYGSPVAAAMERDGAGTDGGVTLVGSSDTNYLLLA